MWRLALFTIGSLLCIASTAIAECRSSFSTVEVPISISFDGASFRSGWIYGTLSPRLRLPARTHVYPAASANATDGRLDATFCVAESDLDATVKSMRLLYGPREIELAVRPVTWHSAGNLRRGSMPRIELRHEKDPDWVVLRAAEWRIGADRRPRIDLQVHNFSSEIHPGFDVRLELAKDRGACYSPAPIAVTVDVAIAFVKGEAELLAADAQFPKDVLANKADVEWGMCGDIRFKSRLGSTGPIAAGGALTIRYLFKEPIAATKAAAPVKGQPVTIASIYALPERSLRLSGERVFPLIVRVTDHSLGE